MATSTRMTSKQAATAERVTMIIIKGHSLRRACLQPAGDDNNKLIWEQRFGCGGVDCDDMTSATLDSGGLLSATATSVPAGKLRRLLWLVSVLFHLSAYVPVSRSGVNIHFYY